MRRGIKGLKRFHKKKDQGKCPLPGSNKRPLRYERSATTTVLSGLSNMAGKLSGMYSWVMSWVTLKTPSQCREHQTL